MKADATKFSETGYVGGDVEDLVRELVQKADGDYDGNPGGDYNTKFERLFGDANGDGRVDTTDLAYFAKSYQKMSTQPGYLAYMDFNADDRVGLIDLFAFLGRFGTHLNP